ncbi:MAG: A/G-specific adenine glycosylase [Jatrophihabitans sp.]
MPRSPGSELVEPLLDWYRDAARDLPWRTADVDAWGVLVSEVMLQQTPVQRVQPAWTAWMARWPTPSALAADPPGEAIRMWGKLGYPRRALRLHACARAITENFAGAVPSEVDDLLGLPGVGAYTARAVAVFAFGTRHPVVDINVRRVIARAVGGQGDAAAASTTRDLAAVEALLPTKANRAARFSIALMELGALVCVARTPRCPVCPIADRCAWIAAGAPVYQGPRPRPQAFTGTDRQVRGLLLDVARACDEPVGRAALDAVWAEPVQRARALDSLIVDGLLHRLPDGRFALPR